MNSEPLVSIVTPCYNHEPYLDDYARSLLNQTYRNVELIFFDDGSTDRSWDKIQDYLPRLREAFPRVICERHANVGAHEEMAQAVDRATGEYFSVLESDDYYLPTRVAECVAYLSSHPEVGVVYSDADLVYDYGIERAFKKNRGITVPTGNIYDALLLCTDNFITTCTACYRTDLVKAHVDFRRYRLKGYLMGDYPMSLDLARQTRFGYIDKTLARYRVLPESACHSRDTTQFYRFWRSALEVKRDYVSQFPPSAETADLTMRQYYQTLFSWGYKTRDRESCFRGYRGLSRLYPLEYRTLSNSIRASSVRSAFLWSFVRTCERMQLYHNSKILLKRLGRSIRRACLKDVRFLETNSESSNLESAIRAADGNECQVVG
jgi:alpha-1,3-rhamnosyltransferase